MCSNASWLQHLVASAHDHLVEGLSSWWLADPAFYIDGFSAIVYVCPIDPQELESNLVVHGISVDPATRSSCISIGCNLRKRNIASHDTGSLIIIR